MRIEDEKEQPKLAEAFRDLEAPLCDAQNMARINYGLVAEALGNLDEHLRVTGKPNCYFISEDQLDALIFSASHVHTMIEAIKKGWYETIEGAPPKQV
jgi:hypothetical protein